MSAANLVMSAAGGAVAKLYVDDVFSAYTYTGNGSTQTINNGIDLAGEGGMVWIKNRETAGDNCVFDTVRGPTGSGSLLRTNLTNASGGGTFLTGFTSSGFSLDTANYVNESTKKIVSWTFRKAPKFFDIVTYTGNGSTQTVNHALGVAPGMIITKSTSASGNWFAYHRGLPNPTDEALALDSTSATQTGLPGIWGVTSSAFTLASGYANNVDGRTYVACLFAHDTSTDGIIQCGSFTTDGSQNAVVNLGWEAQWVLIKRATGAAASWLLMDATRGWAYANTKYLLPDSSAAEGDFGASDVGQPTATGFNAKSMGAATTPFIYLAIRRPNKPPTTGTQVYNAIARTASTNAVVSTVGFAPDAILETRRTTSAEWTLDDRLRGDTKSLYTSSTAAETTTNRLVSFEQLGFTEGAYWSGHSTIYQCFRRAPGFFDQVCYTGTGSATTVAHGLGVVPELAIFKRRNSTTNWSVYHAALGAGAKLLLDTTAASAADTTIFNNTAPTASVFTLGAYNPVNASSGSFVSYLFATLPGISKCGSYTGNGSSQTINCGFTTGARFVLIKRTDSTGDWYVWDSVRGIVSGNDPYLSLNTTAAEVTTDDSIDPNVVGFDINQVAATNINVTSATYIFLSVA